MAHDQELFIKKRKDTQVVLGNREGDERQVKPAIVEAGDHFLRHTYGDAYLRVREVTAQFPEWAAQLVNESCDAGREVEWAHVRRDIIFKILLYMAHQSDHFPRALG